MPKAVRQSTSMTVRFRFRVLCGSDIALGPGKAQLLRLVRETGSIRQAAREMEMSYMRAWGLIRTMNQCFNKPLVEAVRGGAWRGGAKLTSTGTAVLELYEQMEEESLAASERTRRRLTSLLKKD